MLGCLLGFSVWKELLIEGVEGEGRECELMMERIDGCSSSRNSFRKRRPLLPFSLALVLATARRCTEEDGDANYEPAKKEKKVAEESQKNAGCLLCLGKSEREAIQKKKKTRPATLFCLFFLFRQVSLSLFSRAHCP